MHNRFSWIAVIISMIAACVLEVVVLPESFYSYRPEWLALTLIYWLLRHPEKIGVTTAMLTGLMMDVISGTTLGVNTLSFSLIAYLVLNMHQRIKMFPVIQQSFLVFFLVSINLMVVHLFSVLLHNADGGFSYLWLSLTSAIVWPVVLIFTDRLSLFLR